MALYENGIIKDNEQYSSFLKSNINLTKYNAQDTEAVIEFHKVISFLQQKQRHLLRIELGLLSNLKSLYGEDSLLIISESWINWRINKIPS
nr:hypothetical protein [Mycoplasmopsis bovis]